MRGTAALLLVSCAAAGFAGAACVAERTDRDDVPAAHSSTVHARDFATAGAPDSHGRTLRVARWAPMLDPNNAEACGRCHEGVPARPEGVRFPAPGAPDCRSCHQDPAGVLGCTTCHDAARTGAHAIHLAPSSAHATGFACSTCHPVPDASSGPVIGGLHGNGAVEIAFGRTGGNGSGSGSGSGEGSYDPATQSCVVACHDRGGARARPTWRDTSAMKCGDCHASPPRAHFAGACSTCHREADATGTSLTRGPLHLDGRIDLGDGSGGCGACHGEGNDPWPRTNAHARHQAPRTTTPVACSDCHVVPVAVEAPGHLDGMALVTFAGRARDRGAHPTWNANTCADVACHGAKLASSPAIVPSWTDSSGRASECDSCHGAPPPSQHTTSTSCDRSTCHGAEVARTTTGLVITNAGLARHIDGIVTP